MTSKGRGPEKRKALRGRSRLQGTRGRPDMLPPLDFLISPECITRLILLRPI
jgi:hypothetical protein